MIIIIDFREKHYPYVSGDSSESEDCNLNYNNFVVSIRGYEVLKRNNITEIMHHLSHVGKYFDIENHPIHVKSMNFV